MNTSTPTQWIVPQQVTDLLDEQFPGTRNASFRLEVRKAFHQVVAWRRDGVFAVSCQTDAQAECVRSVAEMLRREVTTVPGTSAVKEHKP